ncbi:carboxymuconolactone decarboxylase family protein [Phaeovibrio sulfidiphilus]|uniref:Carboxymuconolactone decarboxylase family protein n=1 Tax=Phaeovibrio sulfidiphilus TaxID=1220600 RepID=A0A8J7CPT1_9PROT|nr:carboxymuconolactone decarboxylase family protein [Phaeovibrio sulfidiphilus]MBE1237412.1 carboxymuconolactone decarboxylase family protein [Phaeovibrio sulfidiphilus]
MYRLSLPFQPPSSDESPVSGEGATAPATDSSGKELFELVSLRVLQINGCPCFEEMYAAALRSGGIPAAKLDGLSGWRTSALFSERERAALQWAESRIEAAGPLSSDRECDPVRALFSDDEISDLGFTIALMSTFNRLAIGMRK